MIFMQLSAKITLRKLHKIFTIKKFGYFSFINVHENKNNIHRFIYNYS
jgi:hypothetical protein